MVRTTATHGPREVLHLAWPVIVQMLSFQLMTTADTLFVAHLGTRELAAVGLALPFVFLFRSFGHGLLGGVRVLTSQRTGRSEEAGARRAGWQGVWIGVAAAVPGPLAASWGLALLAAFGASPDLAALGGGYFQVLMWGSPLTFGVWALSFWFQGRGDTRTPMVATVLGNVLNIALDPVLIWGIGPLPALGVQGAAVATLAAQAVMLVVLVRAFIRAFGGPEPWSLHPGDLRQIWRLGAPLALMESLELGAFAVFAAVLTQAGPVHLATHVVVLRVASLSFLPGHALASATGVLVGQAVGAGDRHGASTAIRSGLSLAVGVMAMMGVLFLVAPGPLVHVFGASAEVEALAVQVLAVAAAFQVFDAVVMVLIHSLTGAGDTRFVLAAGACAAWLVKVPVATALVLPLGWGVVGAWGGFTAELIVLAVILGLRVRAGVWLDSTTTRPAPAR